MADWYYTTNKQQMGPVSRDELSQLANQGLLKPTDLVWQDRAVLLHRNTPGDLLSSRFRGA